MRPTYEIVKEYELLFQEIEEYAIENGGEIPPDLDIRFKCIELEREQKIRNIGKLVKNLNLYEEQLSEISKQFTKRAKGAEKAKKVLKGLLFELLKPGEKFKEHDLSIYFGESSKLDIPNEDLVPDEFVRYERVILREEIKEAIKNGKKTEYASIVKNKNIQVR